MTLRKARWLCLVVIGLTYVPACQDEVPEVRRVALSSPLGRRGLVFASGVSLSEGDPQFLQSDVVFSVRQILTLRGGAERPFCFKGSDLGVVTDIPAASDGCDWQTVVDFGGNSTNLPSSLGGQGYLVWDRPGIHLYRLLLLKLSVDSTGVWTLTFDLAPVR